MAVISYSEVTIHQQCTQRYYYHFGLGLKPIEQSAAISTGVDGHKMLERYYKGLRSGKSQESALSSMHNSEERMTGEKLKAWMLANAYAKDFNSKGQPLMVEEPIVYAPKESLELGVLGLNQLKVGFTPDLVWETKAGHIQVEDYKFVGRAWSKSKLRHYRQLNLYIAFLQELGYKVTEGVLRFFNTTTNQSSSYSFKPSAAELKLLKIDFVREALKIREFRTQPVAEMAEQATRTLNYSICSYCPFNYPCSLEAKGLSAARTFATQYTENDYGYIE